MTALLLAIELLQGRRVSGGRSRLLVILARALSPIGRTLRRVRVGRHRDGLGFLTVTGLAIIIAAVAAFIALPSLAAWSIVGLACGAVRLLIRR